MSQQAPSLPDVIKPMLATLGEPFDSPDFLFEIKWDGIRALAYVEAAGIRAHGRRGTSLAERYPELQELRALPPGCALDGEMVVFTRGLPDFQAVLQREQARTPRRIESLARSLPAVYIVFDLLYENYESIMRRPCRERRARLQELFTPIQGPRLQLSQGIEADGLLFFRQAVDRQLEGVMAKRLSSPYLPGQRTDHWIKCKRRQKILAVIIGYVPDPERGLKSVIVAAEIEGQLRCVGRVGSGIGQAMARRLLEEFSRRPRARPVIGCDTPGKWLEPELFCEISYLEMTPGGQLRAPAFEGLVNPP